MNPAHVAGGAAFPSRSAAVRAVFACMVVVTLLNGLPYWLKRVGWRQPELYRTYQDVHAATPDHLRSPEAKMAFRRFAERLHATSGPELACKAAKDLFVILFLALSVRFFTRRAGPAEGDPWLRRLLAALAAVVLLAAVVSAWRYGPLTPLAGAREIIFLLVAGLGGWAAGRRALAVASFWLLVLLLVQVALAPVELVRGMHLFTARFGGTDVTDRMVGTLIFPISLGVVAVLALNFRLAFGRRGPLTAVAILATLFLIFFSASATAWIVLGASLFVWLAGRVPGQRRVAWWVAGLAALAGLLILLPQITGRVDVYDSAWGRLTILASYVRADGGSLTMLIGKGLGTASNLANQLAPYLPPELASFPRLAADSTPLALLHQWGLLGGGLFYAALGLAAVRDPAARPVFTTLILASLTVNVLELFPANFLLGLLLCRAAGLAVET